MRKKDFSYYLQTLRLKINAWRFRNLLGNPKYEEVIKEKKIEYQKLFENKISILEADPDYYYSYDSLSNYEPGENPDSIFKDEYKWDSKIPTELKGRNHDNPMVPLYYGMLWWNYYLKNPTEELKTKLIDIADYTLNVADKKENQDLYAYQYDFDMYKLEKPWISGITQALACSYFLRMYKLTDDPTYIESAKRAFVPLTISKENEGLLISTSEGMEWVEEYPSTPHSYVFNGFVACVVAAHDLWRITKSEEYRFHYQSWINSIVYHFVEYQYKDYILYDKLYRKLGNIEYQGIHVGQMMHLAVITESLLFYQFYRYYDEKMNWKRYYSYFGLANQQRKKLAI